MTCRFARFWFSQGTLLNLLGAKETSSNVSSFSRDLTRIWFTCSFAPDRIGNCSSLDLPRSLKCFFQVARMVSGPDVVCWSTLSMFPWQHVLDVLKQFGGFYLNLQSKSWTSSLAAQFWTSEFQKVYRGPSDREKRDTACIAHISQWAALRGLPAGWGCLVL